jgi:hypothetical protein
MTARNYALLAAVIFIIIAILQVLRALLGWPITVETGGSILGRPLAELDRVRRLWRARFARA